MDFLKFQLSKLSSENEIREVLRPLYPFLEQESEKTTSVFNLNGDKHLNKSIDLLKKYNIPGDILDIGANRGDSAILFSTMFPERTIYSFEPIEEVFTDLLENTAIYKNIVASNVAIGSKCEESYINVTTSDSSSSILEPNPKVHNSTFMKNVTTKKTEQKISIITLDSIKIISNPTALIKIDVQGFELEVLKGAPETLQKNTIIVLEIFNNDFYEGVPQYHEIDSFLRKNNYELYDFVPQIRGDNGKILVWDSVYVNTKNLNLNQ
jgi:FkbM family methyltransferase